MKSLHIHMEGQVQGVGFRPCVWHLAKEHQLKGWVSNGPDGVHIEIMGEEGNCESFQKSLMQKIPPRARVIRHTVREVTPGSWTDFQIRESVSSGSPNLLITPDLGLCEACRQDTLSPHNRRHNYPFTTCTNCGPRYSIIRKVPYDRAQTTMDVFHQCPECGLEYQAPEDRRFYSQTNSCPKCGVKLMLHDAQGKLITSDPAEIIQRIIAALADNKIIAMKGIGGYLLLCDATRAEVVDLLRSRKHRPTKPFALLYPSLEMVQRDTFVSRAESEALNSVEAPIVLLKARPGISVAMQSVAPNLDHLGIMLPYTPLMAMLMEQWKKPLVATSANESGSPIFYDDEQALSQLQGIADYFVSNNREILIPQDDSVIRLASNDQKIILRRSRGLAPTYLPHPFTQRTRNWLAMGSDMKSSFAFLSKGNVYVSQYLGDLENYQTQQSYEHTFGHWQNLLEIAPQRIIADKHPVYFSSVMGRRLATDLQVTLTLVQHHEAHFAAVLAENHLLESPAPVLGVVWDGTGWGDDGNIWGGEFFHYENSRFNRVAHLSYFSHFLGDKVSREPRLCALSVCRNLREAEKLLRNKFTEREWRLYNQILMQPDLMKTSSVGRLFDAVASLLGICDKSTYEGEAALYIETLASRYTEEATIKPSPVPFSPVVAAKSVIQQISAGLPPERIAYQFHADLVGWICQVAKTQGTHKIAFSGGVFQNALLVRLLKKYLGDSHQLYFHKQLSPNDECIGLGQIAHCYIHRKMKAAQPGQLKEFELVPN